MNNSKTKKRKNNIFIVCEGDTEYHYLNELKERIVSNINIKPVDADGGDYNNILKELKKRSPIGVVARFAIIDFDRYKNQNKEDQHFIQLLSYCQNECKKNNPTFLIVSNPDFDHFILKHDSKYFSQDKKSFLKNNYNMTLEEFKSDEHIFTKFNKKGNELSVLMSINNSSKCIVNNNYSFSKEKFKFSKMKIVFNESNSIHNETNFSDLYKLLF